MLQSKLDDLIIKVQKGQMERNEYEYVSHFLGNKNFLVFGTGYDTEFWRHCNKGINIFLEHDKKWIPEDSSDVYLVEYNTQILKYKDYLNDYSLLEMNLPQQVLDTKWDVIFVDGPPGNKKRSHGRMQSIYTAWKLANENTDVFVHDCNRPVEDTYSKHFFTIEKQLKKLRHCKRKHNAV